MTLSWLPLSAIFVIKPLINNHQGHFDDEKHIRAKLHRPMNDLLKSDGVQLGPASQVKEEIAEQSPKFSVLIYRMW